MEWSISNQVLSVNVSFVANEEIGMVEVPILACLSSAREREAVTLTSERTQRRTKTKFHAQVITTLTLIKS